MTDNARTFTSKEFEEFTRTWDFSHVTSSPNYPQSNGLAERAVCSAKHLLEKCACNGADFYAALLNLRNTPQDGLPSQAQCLLLHRSKSLILMTKSMLLPTVQSDVHSALAKIIRRGKEHYDKSARELQPLHPGQIVRMQTARGYEKMLTVIKKAPQPNSYYVKAGAALTAGMKQHRRGLLALPLGMEESRGPTLDIMTSRCSCSHLTWYSYVLLCTVENALTQCMCNALLEERVSLFSISLMFI